MDTSTDFDSMSMVDVSNVVEVAINLNETAFPFFPSNDDSLYSKHMHQTLSTVEHWMNTQGFYGNTWYKVPDGLMIDPFQNVIARKNPETKVRKSELLELPYIKLLKNLAGPAATQQFAFDSK